MSRRDVPLAAGRSGSIIRSYFICPSRASRRLLAEIWNAIVRRVLGNYPNLSVKGAPPLSSLSGVPSVARFAPHGAPPRCHATSHKLSRPLRPLGERLMIHEGASCLSAAFVEARARPRGGHARSTVQRGATVWRWFTVQKPCKDIEEDFQTQWLAIIRARI